MHYTEMSLYHHTHHHIERSSLNRYLLLVLEQENVNKALFDKDFDLFLAQYEVSLAGLVLLSFSKLFQSQGHKILCGIYAEYNYHFIGSVFTVANICTERCE